MEERMQYYDLLRKVPQEALKTIQAGRLKGMSDINPMYRIKVMTQVFGVCGMGWKYEITNQWQETYGNEVKAFTNVNLYIKVGGKWSDPIPGTGGATIVEVNSKGQYVNDEGFKMALTDALSVAMKALGVAADVYYAKDAKYDTKYETSAAQTDNSAAMLGNIQVEIKNCADTLALQNVWKKYPTLQTNQQFRNAWAVRRGELQAKGL